MNMSKHAFLLSFAAMLLSFSSTSGIKAESIKDVNNVLQDTVKIQEDSAPKAFQTTFFGDNQVQPQFPGGEAALVKWLYDNVHYPADAVEQNIQGRLKVRFVIKSDGSIDEVEIQKSLYPSCDDEAIRVVKMMPKWIPSKQWRSSSKEWVPVNIYYSLPITFKLQKNEQDSVEQIPVIAQDKHYSKDSTQIIYSKVDTMPQFPGGDEALLKWLVKKINYPIEAARQGIQGRVSVGFIVSPDGTVENVEVQKSAHPLLDKEALRVIKMIPKWIPGKQNGNPVFVYYSVPVTFWLSGS